MNIYTLIKADHKKVKVLLKKLTQSASENMPSKRVLSGNLFREIKKELTIHNKSEEDVFYSRLKKNKRSRVLAIEGKCEHDLGAELLEMMSTIDVGSDDFAAKAKVLRELVEHHIKEEEGTVHKQARKELSEQEAIEIGKEFTFLKGKLLHARPRNLGMAA